MNSRATIFDIGQPGRRAQAQSTAIEAASVADLPASALRQQPPALPEVSELQAVRHYSRLSAANFSIDTHFYPLGSCTMKYNPRGAHKAASLPGFSGRHPLTPDQASGGFLECLYRLQSLLQELTGMAGVSLAPMAGAQGEFAGIGMIRAWHEARGDTKRTEILTPDAAHGTNPATAAQCGCQVRETPVDANGDMDITALKAAVGPHTAGMMMTNPSTCGLFERRVREISDIVHAAGGLMYYDGANLNAVLGKVKPADMGFDVLHLNLHKTFSTPHGGGGPGAGPVAVVQRLAPHLPLPLAARSGADGYRWLDEQDLPESIGRLSTFSGNAGILLRALAYILMLGAEGMNRVSDMAVLNAAYLQARLSQAGFELAYPNRRSTHEFILTLERFASSYGVTAMDFAKRLLDHGVHAPTTYFPLMVPECFLIEPTETESRTELDHFVDAMTAIADEARTDPELVKSAPHTLPAARLDDVLAARVLKLRWQTPEANPTKGQSAG